MGVVTEPQLAWLHAQVTTENDPEQPAGDDEALLVSREIEPVSPGLFVRAEGLLQTLHARHRRRECGAPDMDLITLQDRNPGWSRPCGWRHKGGVRAVFGHVSDPMRLIRSYKQARAAGPSPAEPG